MVGKTHAKKGCEGENKKDEESNSFEGMVAVNASAGNGDIDSKFTNMVSKKIKNKEEHQDDFIESRAVDSKAVMEGDENQVIHEKKHRTKKRKLERNEDEKKPQEAGKKHKKIKVGDKIEANKNWEDNFVHGKRFSKEEDEILKKAVYNHIELHGLGKDGLNMILNCQSHPEVINCWKEMGAALPWRPTSSVYHRAHIPF